MLFYSVHIRCINFHVVLLLRLLVVINRLKLLILQITFRKVVVNDLPTARLEILIWHHGHRCVNKVAQIEIIIVF